MFLNETRSHKRKPWAPNLETNTTWKFVAVLTTWVTALELGSYVRRLSTLRKKLHEFIAEYNWQTSTIYEHVLRSKNDLSP